jgi:hypothetical protein
LSVDNLHLHDHVLGRFSGSDEFHDVASPNILEAAEKTVPVSRDPKITQLPDLGRARSSPKEQPGVSLPEKE